MKSLSIYAIALFVLMSTATFAQESYRLVSSELSVAGTSTLHDWESEVTETSIQASLDIVDGQLQAIPKFMVKIPAKGIKSTKGRIMDNKTYDALKADDHPNITFQLTSTKIQANNQLTATGKLTIAGKSKTVSFPVTMKKGSDSAFTFSGSYSLLMSDYGMEAPTALMGSIKTGDEITVKFNCTLEPEKATANSK
jgi:polyisoprenoid-binding protein YceI